MLGAEEFGIGTASLVAMGCIMVRQCHSNTCPVGVCTQDEALRKKFTGTPEKVVNLFSFIAEEVREILARLGFRTLNEVIGRTDLLRQVSRGAAHLDDLDLNPLLAQADPGQHARYCTLRGPQRGAGHARRADDRRTPAALFDDGEKMQLAYNVRNTHRAVGTRLSAHDHPQVRHDRPEARPHHRAPARLGRPVARRLRRAGPQARSVRRRQRLCRQGPVGRHHRGPPAAVEPAGEPTRTPSSATPCLYGATAGKLFAAGQAGERFAVRNSGATAVVEGCGANGCEYMTGGTAVILGAVGDNFGAGMTGGMAFVYDETGAFARACQRRQRGLAAPRLRPLGTR